jgi:ABC-type multidrug transport system fused ATPase/permease subunit
VVFENMMQNRTSIVIASPSTIQKQIIYYSDAKGKIVEQGVNELIALNGMYNKLVTLQSLNKY